MEYINLKFKLRLLIRQSPLLYKIVKGNRIKATDNSWVLCTKDTDMCLEGYPGSANSFLFNVLSYLKPSLKIAHHTHSIANIRLSLKYNTPTLIIIRRPQDAITSRILRFESNFELSILEYLWFYQFVLQYNKRFLIVTFEEVTNNTSNVLSKIENLISSRIKVEDLKSAKEHTFSSIRELSKKRGKPNSAGLPSKKRKTQKKELEIKLLKYSKFQTIIDIYDQLVKKNT